MSARAIVVALIVVVLAAGLWMLPGCGTSEPTSLVPAWQLTPADAYRAETLADPAISWSPDSHSLLLGVVSEKMSRAFILRWNVGDKRAERIVFGGSPNYVTNDTFMFMQQSPKSILEHSFSTGANREVVQNLNKVDLWRELTGFSYNPVHKTIELRVSDFTQFYEPGCEAIDLTGKSLGPVPRATGGGVLDRSVDPNGNRSAVIFGDLAQETRQLRIAPPGEESKAKPVASGNLGAVAWSPDGRLVAFGDSNDVKLLKLSDMKTLTIARFGVKPESGEGACVSRLVWSPNGSYLAALNLVPGEVGPYAVFYVLDMTKVKW